VRLSMFVIVITLLLVPNQLPAQTFGRSTELTLAICTMARDDSTRELQKKLLELRVRLRDIYSGVRCNQLSLMQFAMSYEAINVAYYLASYANIDDLVASGDLEWLTQHDLMETAVGQVLLQRLQN
jgi:hypothetical protein